MTSRRSFLQWLGALFTAPALPAVPPMVLKPRSLGLSRMAADDWMNRRQHAQMELERSRRYRCGLYESLSENPPSHH